MACHHDYWHFSATCKEKISSAASFPRLLPRKRHLISNAMTTPNFDNEAITMIDDDAGSMAAYGGIYCYQSIINRLYIIAFEILYTPPMSGAKRLTHIDGLRGLSILFILMFHAYPGLFKAGCYGVDVFLVISGYFLFLKPMDMGRGHVFASCRDFVVKKAARLVYPLGIMVVLSVIAGAFLLLPEYVKDAATTGFTALFGASNIYLSTSSNNYFAPETGCNPLMHTWYLSVLLQVFAFYMLGNLVLCKAPRKSSITLLSLVGAGSLVCALWPDMSQLCKALSGIHLPFDYYSTTTRLWTVLAGGAIHLMPAAGGKRLESVLAAAGLLVIVLLSSYAPTSHYVWHIAIAAATMLCIRYGSASVCAKVLGARPLQWLGKVSFSLYLVHMPVIAFYRSAPRCGFAGDAAVLCGILLLAWVFYKLVETRKVAFPWVVAVWIVAVALAWGERKERINVNPWERYYPHYAGYDAWKTPPADSPLMQGYDTVAMHHYIGLAARANDYRSDDSEIVGIGSADCPTFILIGDCEAVSFFFGLDQVCAERGLSGAYLSTYMVPYYGWANKTQESRYRTDKRKNDAFFHWLELHPEIRTVIIAQNWSLRKRAMCQEEGVCISREEALHMFVTKVHGMGRQVILVQPGPHLHPLVPDHFIQTAKQGELGCTKEEYDSQAAEVMPMLESMEREGICRILHAYDGLFANGAFHSVENGEYLMRDAFHFSSMGSQKLVPAYIDTLQGMLEEAKPR